MQIIVDANDKPEYIRLAASFLLHLVGDLNDEPAAPEAPLAPPAPPAPPAPLAATGQTQTHDAEFPAAPLPPPPPPPPPSNVLPFPTPPANSNAPTAASASMAANAPAPTATAASAASGTDEYDASGLPWDGRIHQSRKGKKKDGTWKILKGCDPTLVQSVVAELSARKLSPSTMPTPPAQTDAFPTPPAGAAPPPPVSSTVPLPPGPNSLPLPPPPATPAVPEQVPGSAAPLPAPPAPPVGAVSATSNGYRELIAKCSAATKAGKLDGAKLASIVQAHGCPSVQALRDMPHLIPLVETDVDVAMLS